MTHTRASVPDYYAVLQVQADADDEVIAAAYRQLMKKYHPDLAGSDPTRIAQHAARAKAINEAYSALRNPERRRQYDSARVFFGTARATPAPPTASVEQVEPAQGRPPPPPPVPPSSSAAAPAAPPIEPVADGSRLLGGLSALYYLLPGAYEWEAGQKKERLTVLLLPVVTVLGYALVTDRLAAWIGSTLQARLGVAAVVLLLSIPLIWSLPRVALAVGPTAIVLTGMANSILDERHVPIWLAWAAASLISLVFSARLYVFGVVPALVGCWALNAFG